MSACQTCKNITTSITLKSCQHVFCYECLCKHIEANISCKIRCPMKECQKYISDGIIRQCLSTFNVEIYEKSSILATHPDSRKCLTKNCPKYFYIKNIELIIICEICGQSNCFKCNKRLNPVDCGRNDSNEDLIEISATEFLKSRNKEMLKSLFFKEGFIPNPDHFKCQICDEYILPREGLILRNCYHSYCKECFISSMKNIKNLSRFTCQQCNKGIHESDISYAIGIDNIKEIYSIKIGQKYFRCRYASCSGKWDTNKVKGFHKCSVCGHLNCLECKDVHDNMSCNDFRKTSLYKDTQLTKKKLKKNGSVNCLCGSLIIISPGGCGAIYCDKCGIHVCQFTGKLAGNIGPDNCGCTPTKPCHENCQFGCFPENPK